ncbi:COX15/CtaA family protein [Prochlorococcus marinus]|uniref:COX15/CtaA family protein n=1 Tax=Prochlorococcus marinus TaxID=1219 RepID=UPI000533A73D|nr:COX15/CtaA family protein [Prochlorococcus marinus]KGG11241.1 Heme A synthase [Prochlorococcus marinus str. LG]
MTISLTSNLIRDRLGKLAAHIVVALVFLVVIGGATRVMEAGLACPDWPLCYGVLFPKGQMNVRVFLEWFHRLDAFFVGITIAIQFCLSLIFKSYLPKWFPWISGLIFALVIFQGGLGAITVVDLLPSTIVMAHLFLALTLVALMSGLTRRLLSPAGIEPPLWWKLFSGISLFAVIAQSLIGSRMATTWAAQRCLANGLDCKLLDLHRFLSIPVSLWLFSFVLTAIFLGGWFRAQWPFLLFVLVLLSMQIMLGILSVHSILSEPLIRVFHQLFASLLVASLSALCCSKDLYSVSISSGEPEGISLEACHG